MNFFKKNHHKSKAQAMVEFAIVLPLLLLMLYGILETGRYLFIYSSVVTASRQAARYGSATGPGNGSVPRYQDCTGMRAAANAAGYISTFDTVTLQYDSGPGTSAITYCTGGAATDTSLTSSILSDNEHRITATVTEQFDSIVPNIVPFISRPVTATSSRTVVLSISIAYDPPATSTFTPSPTFTPTLTFTPSLTYTPSKTPTITPTLQFTWTPSKTPTATPLFTATKTPTVLPTNIPNCANALSLGALTLSGNSMSLVVTNNLVSQLGINDIYVLWNHDKGHGSGNKKLRLESVSLGGTTIWTGSEKGDSYTFTPTSAFFPAGPTTLSFNFDQTYDVWDPTIAETVSITLSAPGCGSTVFTQVHP
jgi:hypothetical protein